MLWSLQKSVKEGLLLKQTSSFQRWKRRYFKLRGRTLYYAKDAKVGWGVHPACAVGGDLSLPAQEGTEIPAWWTGALVSPLQSLIFDEVDLSDASVAETSTKNINNSFTVREVWGYQTPPMETWTPYGEALHPDLPHPPEPWGTP